MKFSEWIDEWIQRLRQGFQPTFWVANTLELFERLAFYGAKAVLTVYLAIKVGLGPQVAGSLAGRCINNTSDRRP